MGLSGIGGPSMKLISLYTPSQAKAIMAAQGITGGLPPLGTTISLPMEENPEYVLLWKKEKRNRSWFYALYQAPR